MGGDHFPPPISRTPDTLTVLVSVFLVGIAQALLRVQTGVTSQLAPDLVFAWSVLLATGAFIALVGIWYPERIAGIAIELVGRVVLAAECFAYLLGVILLSPNNPLYLPIVLVGALALSSSWRAWQLVRYLRNARKQLKLALELSNEE